jgi:hypothetical protein
MIRKYVDLFHGTYLIDQITSIGFNTGGCTFSALLAIDPSIGMNFDQIKVGNPTTFSDYTGHFYINGVINRITPYDYKDYQYDYSNYKFMIVDIVSTTRTTNISPIGDFEYAGIYCDGSKYGYIRLKSPSSLDPTNINFTQNITQDNAYLNSSYVIRQYHLKYYYLSTLIFDNSTFSKLEPKGIIVVGSPTSSGPSATPVPTVAPQATGTSASGITAPLPVPIVSTPPPPPPSTKAYNAQISNCGASYIKGGIITCDNTKTKAIIHLVEDANAGSFKYPGNGAPISFYIDGISFKGNATSYKRYNASSDPIAIYEISAEGLDDITISDKLLGDTTGAVNVNVYINENGTQDAILNPSGISFGTSKFQYITTGFLNNPPTNYGTIVSWNSFAQNASSLSISSLVYKSHTYVGPNVENLQFDKTIITPVINVYAKSTTATASTSSPNTGSGSITTTTTTGTGSSAVTTTTTSNLNAFGAGTVVTVSPNLQNLPGGTTTTTELVNGLTTTTTVTVDVLANKVTKTVSTTFKPSLNSNPGMAQKRRSLMGIPDNFQGAIDPTIAFPSVQMPPKFGNSQSGVFFQANVSPTSFDLDPYFFFTENTVFQTGVDKQLRPLYGSGNAYKNDFSIVAKDGYSDGVNINIKKVPYNNNVRSMGIRGPVILSGWGYDSRGLPVPNGSNETVQTGVYTDPKSGKKTPLYGLDPSGQYKFNPKTSTRRNLWKTGPVDLRWHDERKVWVGGQEMLEGYLLEDLSPNGVTNGASAIAKMSVRRVINDKGLVGQNEFITVTSRDPNLSASSGAYIMVVDINYEWRPIYVGC